MIASYLARLTCPHSLVFRQSHFRKNFFESFSTSSVAFARRVKLDEYRLTADDAFDLLDDDYDDDDTASAGHLILRQQRQVLYYLRLIEHEIPKLVAYRKPFCPPTHDEPVIVRSLDYAGEKHPATVKRAIVVAVDELPLRDDVAIRKLILLAGPRWSPNPPADSGVSGLQLWKNGFIKIACEDFAKPQTNLTRASDSLDELIAQANKTDDSFEDIPIDIRHVRSKAGKAKRGDHLRGRLLNRPTIKDFPQQWLPPRPLNG